MARRLLAAVAAVAMIAGAFAYRSRDDDRPFGGDGPFGGDRAAGVVVCASELGPVCDAVPGAVVEPASDTFTRVVGARSVAVAGIAVWVAAGPWADMVDAARPGRPPLFGEPEPLGATPLVTVIRKGAAPAACGGGITWRCLGDSAQDPGFRLAGDPRTEAGHLFIRAAALGGFLNRGEYASNDIDESPEAEAWLANVDRSLDRAPSFGAGSLGAFLATRGSTAQAFVTTQAAVRAAGALPDFDITTPSPGAVVVASVAVAESVSADVDVRRVSEALDAAGWNVQPPPPDDGLPSAGVLVALRGRTGA